MRKLTVVAAAALTALLMSACEDMTSSGSGSSDGGGSSAAAEEVAANDGPVAVGQPISVEQPGGAVGTVTVLSDVWQTQAGSDVAVPPDNGAYLVIDVEWSGEGPYNPMYFTFKTEAGHEYDGLSGAFSGYEPTLQSGELAGDKARGLVVFDAPQGPGKVTVTDQMLQPAGSWEITA